MRLHLVRGLPEHVPSDPAKFQKWERERQRASRSELVHVLHGGKAYKFDFSTLQTFSWKTVAKHRIGRLLPPFITQVQHRHAAFLTSEGLPGVLPDMYKDLEFTGRKLVSEIQLVKMRRYLCSLWGCNCHRQRDQLATNAQFGSGGLQTKLHSCVSQFAVSALSCPSNSASGDSTRVQSRSD